ncbi:MAG: 50S ribosomal protein L9 [Elusimicrobiota bacterium]
MEVILKQTIEGLGKIGNIRNVKAGYARNFLIPKGLVIEATEQNLKIVEQEKKRVAKKLEIEIEQTKKFADKLSALSITIPVEVDSRTEGDKMFGSVSASDISAVLEQEGFEIDKKDILLETPIKELGVFDVPVKVRSHPEVIAKIKVWVVKRDN